LFVWFYFVCDSILCVFDFKQDRIGKTLLSQAIEANNLELVTLLVDSPARAKIKGIRVREHEGVSGRSGQG
jgi:hypothetical protein